MYKTICFFSRGTKVANNLSLSDGGYVVAIDVAGRRLYVEGFEGYESAKKFADSDKYLSSLPWDEYSL